MTLALNWVLVDSDLGSDGSRFLAQHRKSSQVLNSISFLGKLLVQRDIQGEHQRFHFISDWTLQKHTEQNLNNCFPLCPRVSIICLLSLEVRTADSRGSLNAPTVTVFRLDNDDFTLTQHHCDLVSTCILGDHITSGL